MKKLERIFALTLILCMALTGIMPVYADKMTVQEAMLTESAGQPDPGVYFEYDPYMNELVQTEVFDYYTLVDSSYTELTLNAGHWYVIKGEVTLQSRVENKSQLSDPANIILTNGCVLNVPLGIENGSRNSLRIYGQDKNGGTGQLIINNTPESWAGIGGGYSPGMDEQGCGYVEINGGILEIHGGNYAAGIGGANNGGDVSVTINAGTVKAYGGEKGAGIGGGNKGVNVSVTINSGKVTAYGGEKGAGIGTGSGTTAQLSGNGKITVNGGTVEAFGGEWAAGIGRGYHGYPNKVEINGGNVTAKGGARGGAGIGGGKDTDGVDTKISGGTVCAFGNVDTSSALVGRGIGRGGDGYSDRSLTITGERVNILSGTDNNNATVTTADTYVRLREPYVRISATKYPVYTVTWMLDDSNTIDTTDVTEGKMPVHSDPVKDGYIFTGWTPALAPVTGDITYTARFYELPHEHTFSDTWSHNETHHWHECTCGHDAVTGFAAHTFGAGVADDNKTAYTCSACGYKKYVYSTAGDDEGEIIGGATYTGISLTLGSDISINFYMELSDDARQNGTMTFNIGGRIVTVDGKDVKYNSTEQKYYFSTPLTALEMAEIVTATFTYNGTEYVQKYSVADYIDEIVGNSEKYGKEAVALAKKIANYGYYAQIYLESIHSNVTIGKDGYEAMDKFGDVDINVANAKEALANYKITVSGTSDNLSLYGSTVYFDAATALNYYVTVKDGVKPTATAVNTVTGETKNVEIKLYKSNIHIVSVKDITATELADDIEVKINNELTLTGSVFAYCSSVVSAHSGDNATDKDTFAVNAMAAFYEYYDAAIKYTNFELHFDTPENYQIFTADGEEITEETTLKCYKPFSFRLVPDDNYRIAMVNSEGLREPDENGLYTISFTSGKHDVIVYTEIDTFRLTVTVEGEDGPTMPDTRISFVYDSPEIIYAQCFAPGIYRIDIPKGTSGTIVVEKSGYREYREDFTADGSTDEICIALVPSKSYSVTFDMMGHGKQQVSSQTVQDGDKVTKPNNPTADGYKFGGWFKERELQNEWNFDTDTVTENTTLYAQWTKAFPHHDTLDAYTWEELKTVSEAISDSTISEEEMGHFIGFAQNAETKKVVLNNNDALYVRIIDFKHDTLASGKAYAGITFMAVNSLNQGYYNGNKGDDSSTYAIGWDASRLRIKMQSGGDIYNLLPTKLTEQISAVTKNSHVGWKVGKNDTTYNSDVYESIDTLFLLSGSELGIDLYGDGEGTEYAYIDRSICPSNWITDNSTGVLLSNVNATGYEFIKEHADEYTNIGDMFDAVRTAGGLVDGDVQEIVFLRSTLPVVSDYYGGIKYDGDTHDVPVNKSACVAPCFCI